MAIAERGLQSVHRIPLDVSPVYNGKIKRKDGAIPQEAETIKGIIDWLLREKVSPTKVIAKAVHVYETFINKGQVETQIAELRSLIESAVDAVSNPTICDPETVEVPIISAYDYKDPTLTSVVDVMAEAASVSLKPDALMTRQSDNHNFETTYHPLSAIPPVIGAKATTWNFYISETTFQGRQQVVTVDEDVNIPMEKGISFRTLTLRRDVQ